MRELFINKKRILEKFNVLFPERIINYSIEFYITKKNNNQEIYKVYNKEELVEIEANTEAGLLYGLIEASVNHFDTSGASLSKERGLNVDCGRKNFSKDWFLRVIERMARYKMNVLQMHFSENEGFRIELNKFNNIQSEHFLSLDELKEVLDYAKYFYIDVQPAFDSPGHMRKILEVYPEHFLENSTQGLDITKESSRQFVKELYDDVLSVFKDATTIHMGGDEFIPFDDYDKYPSLENYAKEQWGPNAKGFDTFIDYINDISSYLLDKDLKVKVWNDGLYRTNQNSTIELNPRVIITYWTSWNQNMAPLQAFIDKGHQVVNFMDQYLYFVLGENAGYTYPERNIIKENFKANEFPLRHEILNMERKQTIPTDSPQFLGTFFSIWCDKPEALSEVEVYDKIKDPMEAFANKSWKKKKESSY